ncbi:MFS transporter [Virgibacillus sp. FSP13]
MVISKYWLQRIQLATGWITLFMVGTDLFVISPLLPSIANEFQINSSKAGWMVTAFSLMYAVSAPWFGSLSDKWGRRRMIVTGLIGFTVANLFTGIASSFLLLLASRILAGLSASMVSSSVFAVTGDSAPEGKRGRWLSIATSGFLTALWSGTPIGTIGSQFLGWRFIFFALAFIAICLALLNGRVWSDQPRREADRTVKEKGKFSDILLDVTVTMFWAGAVYGVYTYIGTGFETVQGLSPVFVAIALVVYGIGAIAGSLSGGRIADAWEASIISTISLLALAILLVLFGVYFSTEFWMWPLLAMWPFAGYVAFSAYQAHLANRFPKRLGIAMAWNQTAMYVGITLGSIAGSFVLHRWSFSLLPIVCGLIALLAAIWNYIRYMRR